MLGWDKDWSYRKFVWRSQGEAFKLKKTVSMVVVAPWCGTEALHKVKNKVYQMLWLHLRSTALWLTLEQTQCFTRTTNQIPDWINQTKITPLTGTCQGPDLSQIKNEWIAKNSQYTEISTNSDKNKDEIFTLFMPAMPWWLQKVCWGKTWYWPFNRMCVCVCVYLSCMCGFDYQNSKINSNWCTTVFFF